jgi:Tfp pilus assembly protein PilN
MSVSDNDMSFLPEGYLEDKSQRRAIIFWRVVYTLVVAGIGLANYYAERNVRYEQAQNKQIHERFEASRKNLERLQVLQNVQQDLNRKVKLSGSLVEKVLRTEILAELTNLLPQNVVLVQVEMENKKIVVPTAAKTPIERALEARAQANNLLPDPIQYDVPIRLTGLSTDDALVAQYMARLSQSRFFGGLRLPETQEYLLAAAEGQKPMALRKFGLEMTLKRSLDTRLGSPATQPTTQAVAAIR